MDVILLGSGGWIPTSRRETCCALVRDGAGALLLDAGTGISRLVEQPELLDGIERLDVLLTHFHLDHVIGLSYLPALPVAEPPAVWGPGRALDATPTGDILHRLVGPPLFGYQARDLTGPILELGPGASSVGSFDIEARIQRRHPGGSLAFRLGDELVYCTDTAYDPENAAFARGAALLCHEAWYAAAETDDPSHTAAGAAAGLAADADVGRLVLIHVSPMLRDDRELEAAAAARFERVAAGEDRVPL
jgi:ribonuclease BN (tRNA processing enzyme)